MSWDPSQFVLERQYCDLKTVAGQLSYIREICASNAAILLVWHRKRFFRSLALCSHANPIVESRLGQQLTQLALRLQESSVTKLLRTAASTPLREFTVALTAIMSGQGPDGSLIADLNLLGPDDMMVVPLHS